MSHKKSSFRILLMLSSVFICLALLFCFAGMGTQKTPDTPKIKGPNESNQPSLVKLVDINTLPAEKVNITEEANSSPGPKSEPAAKPNKLPDNTTADVNDKKPQKHVKSPGDTFNENFDLIFSQYVNKQGLVNYDKLHRYDFELKALFAQLATLDRQKYDSWTRNEKIAFWINTFNLKVLDIIADNYPIESKRFNRLWWPPNSIRHIPPIGKVGTSKWDDYKFIVMDEQFTLSEIENRFFKEEFADPRVFFALSLASLDGPPLRDKPYYGAHLDKQLDEQVKRFLSTPSGIKINRQKNKVELSTLFEPKWPWYGMQFLAKYGTDKKFKSRTPPIAAVLNFICQYLDKRDVNYLETGNYTITFKAYDWRVNEQ